MQNYISKSKSDLKVRCYRFSLEVIAVADALPNKWSAWIIIDQLIRAATSIGANLVEARASSSQLEFKKFYEISLKSANETKYWLCLLRDAGLADKFHIDVLLSEVIEIANMLAAGVLKLKGKKFWILTWTFDFCVLNFKLYFMDSVDVLVSFTKNQTVPHLVRWGGRQYQIKKVNLVHSIRQGQAKIHFFSVSDGVNYFKLGFNTEILKWWIEDSYTN